MDLFITYLEMGETTYRSLLKERKDNFNYLMTKLNELLPKYNERVLLTKGNKISIASTLSSLNERVFLPNNINATFFGSYLFHRRVSGVRVCNKSSKPTGFGQGDSATSFTNYGTHSNNYPCLPYFTAAAAIGQTKSEIDLFVVRLDEAFKHFYSSDPFGIFKKNAELMTVLDAHSELIEEAKEEQPADISK